jgi:hypothetical protein
MTQTTVQTTARLAWFFTPTTELDASTCARRPMAASRHASRPTENRSAELREELMRTDPRKACANEKQLLGWAIVHDLIAHPFMVATGYSRLSLKFHDATSQRAWPRLALKNEQRTFTIPSDRFGALQVTRLAARGFYEIQHPLIDHRFVVKAEGVADAADQAEEWFSSLTALIPESEIARHE